MKNLIISIVCMFSLTAFAEESCIPFFIGGVHIQEVAVPSSYPCNMSETREFKVTFGNVTGEIFHFTDGWINNPKDVEMLAIMSDALTDSMAVLGQYPGILPKKIKLLYLNDFSQNNNRGDSHSKNNACYVRLFYNLADDTTANIKSTIAHEIFHCYQASDMFSGVTKQPYHKWMIEGMAQEFKNIVYPTVNQEWVFVDDFDPRVPLYQGHPYGATSFFQSWHNFGIDLILAQMAIGTTLKATSESDFAKKLSQVTDITKVFQQFIEDFFTQTIKDTGVGYLPTKLPPVDVKMDLKAENTLIEYSAKPFSVTSMHLKAAPTGKYTFKIDPAYYNFGHRLSVRTKGSKGYQRADPGSPAVVIVNCDAALREIGILLTNTDPDAATTSPVLQVDYEPVPEEYECPCKITDTPMDSCLKGNWIGDNEVYAAELGYQVNTGPYRSMTDIKADGQYFMKFGEKQTGEATAVNQAVSAIIPAAGFELDYLQVTNYKLNFKVNQQVLGKFCVEPGNFDGRAVVTINGESSDLDLGALLNSVPASSKMTEVTYRCDAKKLTLYYKNEGRDSFAEWVYHRKN